MLAARYTKTTILSKAEETYPYSMEHEHKADTVLVAYCEACLGELSPSSKVELKSWASRL